MKMGPPTKNDLEKIRAAFWFRSWSADVWSTAFLAGDWKTVEQTITWLRPEPVIRLLGRDRFAEAWPRLRKAAKVILAARLNRLAAYDTWWSWVATGTPDVKPLPAWEKLRGRRREFLLGVAHHPGISIYELAKRLKMQYRRAFDHAIFLERAGFLKSRIETSFRRRVRRLFASQAASTK